MSSLSQRRLECDQLICNIGINSEIIREIENELNESPGDVISLVFLLYNNPDVALHRIAVYQSPCSYGHPRPSPLVEWFHNAKVKYLWKHELIESLLICQLYSIVTKLGFHVPTLKKYLQPDTLNISIYVDPMKKVLYKLCEEMNQDNIIKLKKSLHTYGIHTTTEICELIFLQLMSKNLISIKEYNFNKTNSSGYYQVDILTRIIEKLPGLLIFANTLKTIQNQIDIDRSHDNLVVTSTPKGEPSKVDETTQKSHIELESTMNEVFELLYKLSIEDTDKLKTDG